MSLLRFPILIFRTFFIVFFLFFSSTFCLSPLLANEKPVNLSAYLENDEGPLNGTYPVTISFINSLNEVLWSETHTLSFSKGNFTLPVGEGTHSTDLSADIINAAKKLKLTVAGESVTLGFTSTFFSYLAKQSDQAITANYAVSAGSISWNNVSDKPEYIEDQILYNAGKGLVLSDTTFSIATTVVTNNYQGSITATSFIGDGSALTGITATTVGDNSITESKLTDSSVTSVKLSNNSVTSSKISDGTITNSDISASAAISFSKLSISKSDITSLGIPSADTTSTYSAGSGLSLSDNTFSLASSGATTGQVLKWSGSDWEPASDNGGTSYTAGAGLNLVDSQFRLSGNSVSTNAIQNSAVTSEKINNDAITSSKISDGTITNSDISPSAAISFSKLSISKSDITSLGIPSADTTSTYSAGSGLSLSDNTFSLASSGATTGQVLKWSGSAWEPASDNGGTSYTAGAGLNMVDSQFRLSGNSVSTNAIQNSAVTSEKINNDAITSSKISDGTITNSDISSTAGISYLKLNLSDSILGTDIASDAAIPYSKLSLSKSDLSLGNVDNTSDTNKPISTAQQTALNLKLNIASANTYILKTSTANYETAYSDRLKWDGGATGLNAATGRTSLGLSIGTDVQAYSAALASISGLTTAADKMIYTTASNAYATTSLTLFGREWVALSTIGSAQSALGLGALAYLNSVSSSQITDGTISNSDISSTAAIPFSKLSISKSDITSLGIPDTDSDTTYTAGTGLNLNGTTFAISSIVVTSNYQAGLTLHNKLSAPSALITGTITANIFVGSGAGLSNIPLDNDSVTSAKISDGTITNSDIHSSAGITYSKLNLSGSILGSDIANSTIGASNLADGGITTSKLAFGAITTSLIANNAVISSKISPPLVLTNQSDFTDPIITLNQESSNSNSKVLLLQFSALSTPGYGNAFIDFWGSSSSIGSITGNGAGGFNSPFTVAYLNESSDEAIAFSNKKGVILSSTGADYAEYILKETINDTFEPGDIVGIKEGKVVKSNLTSDQYMIKSQRPVVIGNLPETSKLTDYELIGFIGQVYVKVKGPVKSGQYIVASESEAGIGTAKDESDLTSSDARRIVGMAWETSLKSTPRLIKVGITARTTLSNQNDRISKLEAEIELLKALLKK